MSLKVVHFHGDDPLPSVRAVGGKGYSLIRMAREGLPVPPGFVLGVDFFAPWFDRVTRSEAWMRFLESPSEEKEQRAAALPALAEGCSFDDEQAGLLESALARVHEFSLFAVRSSSPEEDLAGASFAGGYETILGATRATMESAVRRAFASCLEPRVFVYKRERGFGLDHARIAVVIQAQIAAEVAGVGFSVEPITNDYDRAIFNANWGLGETVVSGLASPDQFVVDKLSLEVVESKVGAKETSVWLLPEGGTAERADDRHDSLTLDEDQLTLMTRSLNRVEELYGRPMDIEWAWQTGEFFLLQARPITAYVPLPEEVVTQPGEKRHLYLDATLSIQGIQLPLSVMGADVLQTLLRAFAEEVTGEPDVVDAKAGLVRVIGQRLYVDLSHLFHLVDSQKVAAGIANMDSLVGETLSSLDVDGYLSEPMPPYLRHLVAKVVARVPGIPFKALGTVLRPEHRAETYHRTVDRTLDAMQSDEVAPKETEEYAKWLCERFARLMIQTLIPPFAAATGARRRLEGLFQSSAKQDSGVADDLVRLDQALPHNVTVEMGMELYDIAEAMAARGFRSAEEIGAALEDPNAPADVSEAWATFMDRFGFRGPRELDIGAARYEDRPELLYKQLAALSQLHGHDPRSVQAEAVAQREAASERLAARARSMGAARGKEYELLYRAVEHFGGYRENHKYYLIKALGFLRRRLLHDAKAFVASGRLDKAVDVFDLTLEDVARASGDSTVDLRKRMVENTAFLRRLAQVKDFPRLIDSRGRILRPPRPEPKEGELAGQPISPGRAVGPVKVLHSPDEKPLLPGDVLVARATDPGWTPLFVNAAAIVLEVGGMLQHGSLVAREYGKPCVAGVVDATNQLRDGDVVEVDGSSGLIRMQS